MGNAFLCRPYAMPTITTNKETAAGPAVNLASDRLGRAWQVSSTGLAWVQIDLGTSLPVDTMSFLAASAGTGDTIQWQGADTTGAFSGSGTLLYNGATTAFLASSEGAGRPHRQSLLKLASPVTARYWRANVTLAAAATFGRLVVGRAFQPDDTYDYGWEWSVTDRGKTEISDAGPKGATPNTRHMQFRWQWGWLTFDEARAKALEVMAYAGSTRAVLFCADPDISDVHNVLAWGYLAEGAKVQQIAVDGFSTGYQIDSELILSL